jgi:hypothetical protein
MESENHLFEGVERVVRLDCCLSSELAPTSKLRCIWSCQRIWPGELSAAVPLPQVLSQARLMSALHALQLSPPCSPRLEATRLWSPEQSQLWPAVFREWESAPSLIRISRLSWEKAWLQLSAPPWLAGAGHLLQEQDTLLSVIQLSKVDCFTGGLQLSIN